jgi:hypothetical protein
VWSVTKNGLTTTQNNKLYGISSLFKPFSVAAKILTIQYTAFYSQVMTCAGSAMYLYPSNINQSSLTGAYIGFGPDICNGNPFGLKISFVNNGQVYTNKNFISGQFVLNTPITYTLVMNPLTGSYKTLINGSPVASGSLSSDFVNQNGLAPTGSNLCQWSDIGAVGFQNYQYESGSSFSNISITTVSFQSKILIRLLRMFFIRIKKKADIY